MLEIVELTPQERRLDRSELRRQFNRRAGKGNWFWAFRVGKRLYSWELGMQMYEDAYWNYLRNNVDSLKQLVQHYDVYVWDRLDLEAGLDYRKQDQERDHFPDIALRRVLVRLGVWFQGKDLLHLPGSDFNDPKIPFHLPHLLCCPDRIRSARAWLDYNRVVVVARAIEDKHKLSEVLVK